MQRLLSKTDYESNFAHCDVVQVVKRFLLSVDKKEKYLGKQLLWNFDDAKQLEILEAIDSKVEI